MAVRLREADNIAAMAELQQQISELEIQVKISIKSTCLICRFNQTRHSFTTTLSTSPADRRYTTAQHNMMQSSLLSF